MESFVLLESWLIREASFCIDFCRQPPTPRCSVLQCVAVCCSVLCNVAQCYSVWQRVAMCCSVLQCVVLQCVASARSSRCLSLRVLHHYPRIAHPHPHFSAIIYISCTLSTPLSHVCVFKPRTPNSDFQIVAAVTQLECWGRWYE